MAKKKKQEPVVSDKKSEDLPIEVKKEEVNLDDLSQFAEPIKVREDNVVELDDFGNPKVSSFGAK